MNDIENEVYTYIASAVRKKFKDVLISGEYLNAPSSFPYVSIVEQDNYTEAMYNDSGDAEAFSTLMYEINVYSNKSVGKKAVCRDIINYIDKLMYSKNFRRISLTPVPNMENATIYRVVARYRGVTDGMAIYRR